MGILRKAGEATLGRTAMERAAKKLESPYQAQRPGPTRERHQLPIHESLDWNVGSRIKGPIAFCK